LNSNNNSEKILLNYDIDANLIFAGVKNNNKASMRMSCMGTCAHEGQSNIGVWVCLLGCLTGGNANLQAPQDIVESITKLKSTFNENGVTYNEYSISNNFIDNTIKNTISYKLIVNTVIKSKNINRSDIFYFNDKGKIIKFGSNNLRKTTPDCWVKCKDCPTEFGAIVCFFDCL